MKKKPFSWLGASMVFAIGAVIVLVLAVFLGRGLSMNTKTGEIKVDSKQAAEGQPVAETFGKASPKDFLGVLSQLDCEVPFRAIMEQHLPGFALPE